MNHHTYSPSASRSLPARAAVLSLFASLAIIVVLLLPGCGAKPLDAAAPAAIGPLQQVQIFRHAEALPMVTAVLPGASAPVDGWAAAYGAPGQIRITVYAAKYAAPAGAQTAAAAVEASARSGQGIFKAAAPLTVAGQAGWKIDGEGKDYFLFHAGPWVLVLEGMARDFDPTVSSIQWVKGA